MFKAYLCHPSESKLKHSLPDMLDLFCDCGSESEATMHYLLLCSTYQNERLTIVRKKFEKKH